LRGATGLSGKDQEEKVELAEAGDMTVMQVGRRGKGRLRIMLEKQ
jgi:hypothetical protein